MTKKMSKRQTDKLFTGYASDLYDKFVENAVAIYAEMFPEHCTSKDFAHGYYDLIRERLVVEFGALYAQAKGEKNVESKCEKTSKKAKPAGTVAK